MALEAAFLSKPRFTFLGAAALAAGLLLAACDTQEAADTQPGADGAGAKQVGALEGTLDRSFAGSEKPEAVLVDPDGRDLDLAETDGKPVLLNLWATWCVPCITEMPLLDQLAAEMGDEITVLTVSEDLKGAEVVVPFFEDWTLPNLPKWMDPTNELAFNFGGGAVLPLTVLYDAQGKEVFRVIGGYDWSSEQARTEIREALAEGQAAEAGEEAPAAAASEA